MQKAKDRNLKQHGLMIRLWEACRIIAIFRGLLVVMSYHMPYH